MALRLCVFIEGLRLSRNWLNLRIECLACQCAVTLWGGSEVARLAHPRNGRYGVLLRTTY
ncbi:hypothetical protein BURKHO8Y_120010 [Burkholderia sp. 8Y]|nr:hypothetical protein BURKHO8Y_120010 [Burkholderia sp. 8Y]